MSLMHMLIDVIVAVLDNQTQLWKKYNLPLEGWPAASDPHVSMGIVKIHLKMARTILNLMHMCAVCVCTFGSLLRSTWRWQGFCLIWCTWVCTHICEFIEIHWKMAQGQCLFAKTQVRKRAASIMNHDNTCRKFKQSGWNHLNITIHIISITYLASCFLIWLVLVVGACWLVIWMIPLFGVWLCLAWMVCVQCLHLVFVIIGWW